MARTIALNVGEDQNEAVEALRQYLVGDSHAEALARWAEVTAVAKLWTNQKMSVFAKTIKQIERKLPNSASV